MVDADCLPFGLSRISLFGYLVCGSLSVATVRTIVLANGLPVAARWSAETFSRENPGARISSPAYGGLGGRGLRLTPFARGGTEVVVGGTSEKDLSEWRK